VAQAVQNIAHLPMGRETGVRLGSWAVSVARGGGGWHDGDHGGLWWRSMMMDWRVGRKRGRGEDVVVLNASEGSWRARGMCVSRHAVPLTPR